MTFYTLSLLVEWYIPAAAMLSYFTWTKIRKRPS